MAYWDNGSMDDNLYDYASDKYELRFESATVCDQEVTFLAYLTSFNQTFVSNWTSEEVFGRIDPIATFQGNKRAISLSWDVPAEHYKTAKNNLDLYSQLIQMLYPNYVNNTNNALAMSKSPLVRLKFANLICKTDGDPLLGWISSLSWNPVLEMGYFESGNYLYPKVVSLSIDFNVLHEDSVGYHENKWSGKYNFPFNPEPAPGTDT